MSAFVVRIEKTPRKFLKTLQISDKKRIDAALTLLADNPIPPKAKKLSGRDGYRIRVGDYQIIYEIQKSVLVISVSDIVARFIVK